MDYETMSPPGSPAGRSSGSSNLSARQYFCVNLSKFLIEIMGTCVFTIAFHMYNGRYEGILLSLWVITLFGINISGSHYNPCITICQMFRKTSTFGRRRLRGIIYIVGQILGAMLGALLLQLLLKKPDSYIVVMPAAEGCVMQPMQLTEGCQYGNDARTWKTFESILSEAFGSFIYVLFFMICTDDKLKYSNDTVKNSLVIASSYIAAQMMAGGQFITQTTGPCLNPGVALGLAIFSGNFSFPQYIFVPFLGAALALIFYEFVFVKTQEYLADDEEDEEGMEEEDDEDEDDDKQKLNGSTDKDQRKNSGEEVNSD